MFTFAHLRFLSAVICTFVLFPVKKKPTDYKGLNPRFQNQNCSKLICSNLITHILVFHWRYTVGHIVFPLLFDSKFAHSKTESTTSHDSGMVHNMSIRSSLPPPTFSFLWYHFALLQLPSCEAYYDQLYCNIATKRIQLQKKYFINILKFQFLVTFHI